MIRLQTLLALAVAFALAACQQPGGGANQTATAGEDDALARAFAAEEAKQAKNYQLTPFYKTKIKDVMVSMTDRILTKCIDSTSKAAMHGCTHERVLAGFDEDGSLASHCPPREEIEEDFECIVFGGIGTRLASGLGKDDMAGFDWTAPEESARGVLRKVVLGQLRDCLSSGSASDPFDCFVERVTKRLGLSTTDLDPCAEFKDDDAKFGGCIGEAFVYKYMSEGVARM